MKELPNPIEEIITLGTELCPRIDKTILERMILLSLKSDLNSLEELNSLKNIYLTEGKFLRCFTLYEFIYFSSRIGEKMEVCKCL